MRETLLIYSSFVVAVQATREITKKINILQKHHRHQINMTHVTKMKEREREWYLPCSPCFLSTFLSTACWPILFPLPKQWWCHASEGINVAWHTLILTILSLTHKSMLKTGFPDKSIRVSVLISHKIVFSKEGDGPFPKPKGGARCWVTRKRGALGAMLMAWPRSVRDICAP